MTPENNELDNIRRAWTSMGESLSNLTPNNIPTDKLSNMKTTLDRLADKYKRFSIMGLVMIVASSLMFSRRELLGSPWNIYLPIAYACYFFIGSAIDHWLYYGIKSINPLTMSISEVAGKALLYKKRHIQSIFLLLPMAVALIIATACAFSFDSYIIVGMITGGLVGLAIGITQLCRFMSYYRDLSE